MSQCTDRLNMFKVGQRVELSPATDRWMMGDKYGEVTRVKATEQARDLVTVRLDKSGKSLDYYADYVMHLNSNCPCRTR